MSQLFNMLEGFDYAQRQGEAGRQRGEQSYLSKLAGQAYQAPPDQRRGIIGQAITANADSGFAIDDRMNQDDDRKYQMMGRIAGLIVNAPEAARPGLWKQVLPQARQLIPEVSDDYDPQYLPVMQQLAETWGGVGGEGGVSVRSSFVGEDGQMYSIMSDGSVKAQGVGADRKLQAFDVPGVGPQVVDLRNATARGVTREGMGPPQAPGRQFDVQPSGSPMPTDPLEMEAARRAMTEGGTFHVANGQVVRGQSGQPQPRPTLDRVPLSQLGGGEDRPAWVRPSSGAAGGHGGDIDRRIDLARELGASNVDIRRMVLGRDAAAGGSKPMPASVLKMREQAASESETANTINMSIDKHLQRIQAGSLGFGPVSNLISEGQNALGFSNEQSRNLAEFRGDLEKLRNDSLRLNTGVQTDGDAQRAWNELVANINDTKYVKQRLETIRLLNERAALLKRESVERIDAEYGRADKPQPAEDDIDALLAEFGN